MNIDLRNVSPDFEEAVIQVKLSYDINTNSKAVEFCTVNYLKNQKKIGDLEISLSKAKAELRTLKYHLGSFKSSFDVLFKDQ
ncbi:hypothetical protein [Flavobacterium phage FLiP]|uniref:Uncharacterized protein n=1 Tax=Flavobacterium phage FLiP TaxID=2023716 RepID=A0A222NP90_9VIRU|nr:hypothetical protein HOR88_gp16 [Flavobacterium phage FLiP]ASQ41224.1 hypothetical protein [Flavobacterium phage FLiP]